MRKIELIDKVSGRIETKELEYKEFETEEIESLKRWFAKELVSKEWIKAGKAEMSDETGFELKDFRARSYATFRFQCIEREKEIEINKFEKNK